MRVHLEWERITEGRRIFCKARYAGLDLQVTPDDLGSHWTVYYGNIRVASGYASGMHTGKAKAEIWCQALSSSALCILKQSENERKTR